MKANDFFPDAKGASKSIVIIGGGVTGALTAFELAHAGHKVTLIEAGGLGNGSSSRSAACIRQQFGTPSTVRGMIFCTKYYDNWTKITGCATSPIVHSGYLFLKDWTTNQQELGSIVQMQNDAGLEEVQILTVSEINKLFPYIDTTGIIAATWCPSDGFLYPDMIFNSAGEAAKSAGATIICNDEVVNVRFSGTTPIAVETRSGKLISADIFINTAGVWAPKVSALFNGHPLDIKARRRYLYFIDEFRQDAENLVLDDEYFKKLPMIITPRGCYCRPESKGSSRLMTGWLQHADPIDPQFDLQDQIELGFGVHDVNDFGYAVRKELETYIYDISQMKQLHAVSSGFYEDTPDHNPLIGYDSEIPNLIHCAGFSGHGLMHAPFSARIVANLVSAGRNVDEITLPLVGKVDVKTFHVEREFAHGESMVI